MDKNINTFFAQYKENQNSTISNLNAFTALNKIDRFIISLYHIKKIKYKNFKYCITKDNKDYEFEILSDKKILDTDKKTLHDREQRSKDCILRTLKIASSNKLPDSKIIVSMGNEFKILVEYKKNNKSYIIDYESNLIMEKYKYFELFEINVVNEINKKELYIINDLLEKELYFNIFYVLFFSKEILNDLSKNYSYFTDEYDDVGKNIGTYYALGDNCDSLFDFYKYDYKDLKDRVITKISIFTQNPNINKKNKDNKYIYKDGLKKIKFELLSDYINDEEMKNELLSDRRYGECHGNSIKIMSMIKNNAYLINGEVKRNDLEYVYHTWVELEKYNETLVLDYNHNLVMKKEDYYKLMGARVINKSSYTEVVRTIKLLQDYELYLHPMTFGYFSQEIIKDLEKNKQIIR